MVTLGSEALKSSSNNCLPLSSKTFKNKPFTMDPAGAISSRQSLPSRPFLSSPFAGTSSLSLPSQINTLCGKVLGRILIGNCFNSLTTSLTVILRLMLSTKTNDILILTVQGALPGASFTFIGGNRPWPCSMLASWGPPTNASHSACSLVRLSLTEHGWFHWSRTWTINSGNSS